MKAKPSRPQKNSTKNWTIARRIALGGGILLAFLIAIGTVSQTAFQRLESFAANRLRDDAIPGLVSSAEVTTNCLVGYIKLLKASITQDPARRDKYIAESDSNIASSTKALDTYERSITMEEDRVAFADLKQRRALFQKHRATFLALLREGKTAEAETFRLETLEPVYFAFQDRLSKVLTWNADIAKLVAVEMTHTSRQARLLTTAVAAVALVLSLIIGWFIIRGINRALRQMAVTLNDSSAQVAASSQQVAGSSQSLAEGASEQAASLEETSASLEELSSMTKRNADSAQQAKASASQTRQSADTGAEQVKTMQTALTAIAAASNDISKILKTIDEIAFQTNILALNAAVEAARAGTAGAGFAVVADEVRALAQRCAAAAKETAVKIEDSVAKSNQGTLIGAEVARSFESIQQQIVQLDTLVGEIATASTEQSQGIGQVTIAISQMDKVTQANAAGAEESAAASQDLNAQADVLSSAVSDLQRLVGVASKKTDKPVTALTAGSTTSHRASTPAPIIRKVIPHGKRPSSSRQPALASATGSDADAFFKDV